MAASLRSHASLKLLQSHRVDRTAAQIHRRVHEAALCMLIHGACWNVVECVGGFSYHDLLL